MPDDRVCSLPGCPRPLRGRQRKWCSDSHRVLAYRQKTPLPPKVMAALDEAEAAIAKAKGTRQ